MKKHIALIIFTVITLQQPLSVAADGWADNMEMKFRFGYNIGGTAPIGIPATIRSLDSFNLTPSFMVGFDVALPFGEAWGLQTGLHLENKALDVDVTTKSYHMEVKKGDDQIEGLFTGHVSQEVTEWMLTLPVQATYKLSQKVMLKGGPYASVLLSRDFSGIASDGYLRQGDPTGAKVIMGDKEGEWATYEFSDDMRHLQLGVAAGVDWQVAQRIGLSADLSWGLTGIFRSNFKTVEQTLYPIYGTIGVYYNIR